MLDLSMDGGRNHHPATKYNFACRRILEFLRSELALSGCVLYHQQDEAGLVEFMAGCIPGVIEGHPSRSLSIITNAVFSGQCASIVPDIAQSAYQKLELFSECDPVSIVATPICKVTDDHSILLCGVSLDKPQRPLTDRQALLEFCARQIEHAISCYTSGIENNDAIEFLTEQAYQDAMTGLLNRNGWEAAVATTIGNGFGVEPCVSVFVIDVNDLKQINDNQGHAAGDDAIRQVALVLQQSIAPHGVTPFTHEEPFVARTGGDEFIGLQFGCDDEGAIKLMLEIAEELANQGISISTGSACCRSVRKLPDAIINADEAMYAHKKQIKSERNGSSLQFKEAG